MERMKDTSGLKGLLTALQIKYMYGSKREPVSETFSYIDDEIWAGIDLYFWIEKDDQLGDYYVYRIGENGPQIRFPKGLWGPNVSLVIQSAIELFWDYVHIDQDSTTV